MAGPRTLADARRRRIRVHKAPCPMCGPEWGELWLVTDQHGKVVTCRRNWAAAVRIALQRAQVAGAGTPL
jgi:hypothetical protein